MTWQRIGENTYVDDTLVTCAEYQLFIDEMRAQGKYYQPDHWTSYQFSAGQAREPVLGIRFSDAKAFCEWLTGRDNSGWMYRLPGFYLPSIKEEGSFPIKQSFLVTPIGYWVIEENIDAHFAWIGETPTNARNHNLELWSNPFINLLAFEADFDKAKNCPLEIDYYQFDDTNQTLSQFRSEILDRSLTHGRKLDLSRAHSIAMALDRTSGGDRALSLFIDIFTLQERIAGRSPAFEGIRLVKELK